MAGGEVIGEVPGSEEAEFDLKYRGCQEELSF